MLVGIVAGGVELAVGVLRDPEVVSGELSSSRDRAAGAGEQRRLGARNQCVRRRFPNPVAGMGGAHLPEATGPWRGVATRLALGSQRCGLGVEGGSARIVRVVRVG